MEVRLPKGLLYDFKRTLTSKSVITVMALPIVISLAIIPLATPAPSPPNNTGNNSALLYFDSSGYHFLVYSTNQFGQQISGQGLSSIFLTQSTTIPRVEQQTSAATLSLQ